MNGLIFSLSFLKNPIIVLIAISFLFSLLGIFVIIRKMSFLGEGIAHSSILALALAYLFNFDQLLAGIIWAIFFSLLIFFLEKNTTLTTDVLIAILFISSLSLGIIIFSIINIKTDLLSILFGNVFIISSAEVWFILIVSLIIFLYFLKNYKKLLLIFIHKDIARLEGIKIEKNLLIFYIFLAITIILGIKALGIILVNALLIIPASISNLVSKSFSDFMLKSIIFSEIISLSGLFSSYYLNLPTGPTITIAGCLLLLLILTIKKLIIKI
ncbi:MAG: metal ABC transporter permease [Candidatus Parcubacteria bacterium]|nr:MAG: metal ABC transporter permease [Candidatus Parcubacteria bacterium]